MMYFGGVSRALKQLQTRLSPIEQSQHSQSLHIHHLHPDPTSMTDHSGRCCFYKYTSKLICHMLHIKENEGQSFVGVCKDQADSPISDTVYNNNRENPS